MTTASAPTAANAQQTGATTFKFRSRFPSPNVCLRGSIGCQFNDHVFVTDDAGTAEALRRHKAMAEGEFWEETAAVQAEIADAAKGDGSAEDGGKEKEKDKQAKPGKGK